MLTRTCTAGDQQLHDLKAVELGSIVHSSVAFRILDIQDLCLAVFGQSVQPLANHILSPISGSLESKGKREGRRGERGREGEEGGTEEGRKGGRVDGREDVGRREGGWEERREGGRERGRETEREGGRRREWKVVRGNWQGSDSSQPNHSLTELASYLGKQRL